MQRLLLAFLIVALLGGCGIEGTGEDCERCIIEPALYSLHYELVSNTCPPDQGSTTCLDFPHDTTLRTYAPWDQTFPPPRQATGSYALLGDCNVDRISDMVRGLDFQFDLTLCPEVMEARAEHGWCRLSLEEDLRTEEGTGTATFVFDGRPFFNGDMHSGYCEITYSVTMSLIEYLPLPAPEGWYEELTPEFQETYCPL